MKSNENRQWTLNLFKEAYGEEGANEKASQLILNHRKGNYRQEMAKALSDARNKIMPILLTCSQCRVQWIRHTQVRDLPAQPLERLT